MNKNIKYYIQFFLILSLICTSIVGNAQKDYIKFDRISSESGLVQDHVFCMLKDKSGFLWLGTEMGLVRYDAYYFKIYQHDPDNPVSISSNIIKAIHQDKEGYLWIGTDGGGLNRFDPKSEEFISFQSDISQINTISGNRVYSIQEDKSGNIWIGTLGSGLNKLIVSSELSDDPESYQFERFRSNIDSPDGLTNDNIWTMKIDRSDRLWIGTVAGGLDMLDLSLYDENEKAIFRHFKNDINNPGSISGNSIKSIFQDKDDRLWIGTEFAGLNRLDSLNGRFKKYLHNQNDPHSISHNYVNSIIEDKSQKLWIGTNGGGINIFNPDLENFVRHQHTAADPFSLSGDLVNVLYEDNTGIIWIGMVMEGLSWIDPKKQQIKHYYPISTDENSLSGKLVKALYEDKSGQIWIGTYGGGLSVFDPIKNDFKSFIQNSSISNKAANNNVQTIYEDSNNTFWIGTDGGGLYQFDRQRKQFIEFNHSPSGKTNISGKSIWSIWEDIRGNLWVGTADGGLNLFDKSDNEFHHFKVEQNLSNGINSNDVRVIMEDHLGIIWVGTYGGGLNYYNPSKREFIHYKNIPGDPESISNDIITSIFESPSNKELWIGTFGGGLNKFDRNSHTFKVYREKDGLPNDVVKSIEEDMEGNLWVSTLQGIGKFNPENNVFANYSTSDGLQNAFSLGASCTSSMGDMYFGGTNGFNVFHPEKIREIQQVSVPCLITDLKIFNRSVLPGEKVNANIILPKAIHLTEKITIPYTIDNIAFEFAALDFAQSEKVQYAFMMEGIDENWRYADAKRRYAPYSYLSAGDYTFKLKSTDIDGSWNSQITRLNVEVLSPPWSSWWAYLIYAGSIALLIFLVKKFTVTRIKLLNQLKLERLKRKKVRELNEMKFRFFTNISHEIRTPLTLILSPLESLISSAVGSMETRSQLQTMYKNASRLLTLVNQLLEFREQESGHNKLQVAKGNIVNFIHEVTLAFKEYAFSKNIKFSFKHEEKEISAWFDREQMEKVVYNLISNALKFTPDGGEVSVHVYQEGDLIKFKVEDNGIGISDKEIPFIFDRFSKFDHEYSGNYLGSGIGLALTKNLVELHKGTIEVESNPGDYTRFVVSLLQGMKHFNENQIISDFKGSEAAAHYGLTQPEQMTASNTIVQKEVNGNHPTLLIIEDNADVRQYLVTLFKQSYNILEAEDGHSGLELAIKHFPDLIISDIMMPEMDGIELCRKLKTSLETSHIPIILLTARTSLVFRSEGLESGADDYITKPFNSELLVKRVYNLIESRRQLRKRFSQEIKIEPKDVTFTSPDATLLQKIIQVVEDHIDDSEFDIKALAREVGISRPVLYRKLPALTNYTPNGFIRIMRLKRAAQILSQNVLSVSEVCYNTGFKTPKYFSKCFREEFGVSPSEYARNKAVENI